MLDGFDEKNYRAGYHGQDSMRDKARRLMLEEMMTTEMNKPASHSTPSHETMRLYKKGGHVKHHKHHEEHEHHHKHHKHYAHEDKERKRAHLHKLQREGLHETERNLEKERHLSHGGKARHHKKHHHDEHHMHHEHHKHHMHEGGLSHHHKHHPKDIMGGSLTNMHFPKYEKLNVESISEAEHMRKGGHMHKHKHHEHKHHEHHHHKDGHHHHKRVRKAAGGTVYEHEMLGEHPSTKRPHINYEKDMRGVHPIHKSHPKTGVRHGNPGAVDESFGQYLKKGGKACKKMAAGGAAKIRHGVMTPAGRPIMKKRKMGY
jgi:hypothetical protein